MNTCRRCESPITEKYYCAACNGDVSEVVSVAEWLKWCVPCVIPVFGLFWIIAAAVNKNRKRSIVGYARILLVLHIVVAILVCCVVPLAVNAFSQNTPVADLQKREEETSSSATPSTPAEETLPQPSFLDDIKSYSNCTVYGEDVISAIKKYSAEKIGIVVITEENTAGRNYIALFQDDPVIHYVRWSDDDDYIVVDLPDDWHPSYSTDYSRLKDEAGGDYVSDASIFDSKLIRKTTGEIVGIIFKQQGAQPVEEAELIEEPRSIDSATADLINVLVTYYPDLQARHMGYSDDRCELIQLTYAEKEGLLRKYATHDMAKLYAVGTLLEHRYKNSGTAGDNFSFWYNDDASKDNHICIAFNQYVIQLDLGDKSSGQALQLIDLLSPTNPVHKQASGVNRLESTTAYMSFIRKALGGQFTESTPTQRDMIETLTFEAIGLKGVVENYTEAPIGVWAGIQQTSEKSIQTQWRATGDNFKLIIEDVDKDYLRLWLFDSEKFRVQIELASVDTAKQVGEALVKTAGALTVNWEEVLPTTPELPDQYEELSAPPSADQVEKLLELSAEFPALFKKHSIPTFDAHPTIADSFYQWKGYLKDGRVACYILFSSTQNSALTAFEADKALAMRTGAQLGSERTTSMFKVVPIIYTGSATYVSLVGEGFYCRLISYPEEKRDVDTLVDELASILAKLYETQIEDAPEA